MRVPCERRDFLAAPLARAAARYYADEAARAWSIQCELELPASMNAEEALHELWISKMKIIRGYSSWMSSLLRKAGCEIKTIERPWSQHYALDGKWWLIRRA